MEEGKGRPIKRWNEVVKELIEQRDLSFQESERRYKNRSEQKVIVKGGGEGSGLDMETV